MTETELAGYTIHPVADIFPLLADDELQELADDIRVNGLHQPIVRDAGGVIIDGRNRLLSCLRAGVDPRFTALPEGADPVAFIVSSNEQRRHLGKGQIAMAVARVRLVSKQSMRAAAGTAGISAQAQTAGAGTETPRRKRVKTPAAFRAPETLGNISGAKCRVARCGPVPEPGREPCS